MCTSAAVRPVFGAGAAWHETWSEKAYHDPHTVELVVERTAHKWVAPVAAAVGVVARVAAHLPNNVPRYLRA